MKTHIVRDKCHAPSSPLNPSLLLDLQICLRINYFFQIAAAQSPFSQLPLPSITVFHDVQSGREASHTPSLSGTQ